MNKHDVIIWDESSKMNWKSKATRILAEELRRKYGSQIIEVSSHEEFREAIRK